MTGPTEARTRAGRLIPKPIFIADGAWVGARAVILEGVRIESGQSLRQGRSWTAI